MPDIFSEYKPLRNYLRNTNLLTGLGAIRWYIAYHHFEEKDPPHSDMQVDPLFYKDPMNPYIYLAPWHLAVLARELIINSPSTNLKLLHDLRQWNDLSSAINKLKAIDDAISRQYINQKNILQHLSKVMSHQQFVWQENRPNKQTMSRYYHIYKHPAIRPIFERFFRLSVEKHFALGMVSWFKYSHELGLNYPPNMDFEVLDISLADYDNFIKHYSLTMEELKEKLQDPAERRIGHDFLYYFDSLKQYPIIFTKLNGVLSYICPVPTYMFWRTTDGIYYELLHEEGFDQAIGVAFKDFIGEVMQARKYPKSLLILDADTYVQGSRPKPDWILAQGKACAFIECKAKRMTLQARGEADYGPATESQIEKLAEAIVQAYLAILDAELQKYTELSDVSSYYPLVVTMENWFVFGDIAEKLEYKVKILAKLKNVPEDFVEKNPYLVLSSQEYEMVCEMLKTRTLDEIFSHFFDKNFEGWQFSSYLIKYFPNENRAYNLFDKNLLEEIVDFVTDSKG